MKKALNVILIDGRNPASISLHAATDPQQHSAVGKFSDARFWLAFIAYEQIDITLPDINLSGVNSAV